MTTFLIIDLVKWGVRVQASSVELIEKSYRKPITAIPRGLTQQIGEYPDELDVNINTFKDVPREVVLEGIARYARRKAGAL